MAGELLCHPLDLRRYAEVAPVLAELDAARGVGEAARRLLLAFVTGAKDPGERELQLARRVLATPGVDLRVHADPWVLDNLVATLFAFACLPDEGEFSLVRSVGPGWVVLDGVCRMLHEYAWYPDVFLDDHDDRWGATLPLPVGESSWRALKPEACAVVVGGLDLVLATRTDLHEYHRAELRALRAFAAGALDGGARGLVCQCLL